MDYALGLPLVAVLLVAILLVRRSTRQQRLRRRLQGAHRTRPKFKPAHKSVRAEMRALEHTTTIMDTIRKPPTQPGRSARDSERAGKSRQGRATVPGESQRGRAKPSGSRR